MSTTKTMLPAAESKDDLEKQLNELETAAGKEVIAVGLLKAEDPPQKANFAEVRFNIDADQLKRLSVQLVPEAAWSDKDAFKKFIAPLLENAAMLARSVVVLNNKELQIVVLRPLAAAAPSAKTATGKTLKGDGTWPWFAEIDGDDIVVHDAIATAFGGSQDSMDSGETASGCPTKGNPNLMGCALPMDGYGVDSLKGSPLPKIPFGVHRDCSSNAAGAQVLVTHRASGKSITVPAVDLGPGKGTGHALDLTVAAAKEFDSSATANNFEMKLDYRILGGAKFVS